MSALQHRDDWLEADERALRRLPQVQELAMRTNDEMAAWGEAHTELGREYWWGQKDPPWEPGYAAPPVPFEERLDSVRKELRTVRSEIVPFEEPLLFALDNRLGGRDLKLPNGVEPVGPRHRLCLFVYGFDLKPDDSEIITRIEPRLTYLRPKGLTYSMIPNTELEKRFRTQTRIDLSVTGESSAGVPSVSVAPLVEAKAQSTAKAASVVSWHWEYEILRAKVLVAGIQSSFAEWRISKTGLMGPLELRAVIRLPKQARQLSLEVGGSYRVKKSRFGWKRERAAQFIPTKVSGRIVFSQ